MLHGNQTWDRFVVVIYHIRIDVGNERNGIVHLRIYACLICISTTPSPP